MCRNSPIGHEIIHTFSFSFPLGILSFQHNVLPPQILTISAPSSAEIRRIGASLMVHLAILEEKVNGHKTSCQWDHWGKWSSSNGRRIFFKIAHPFAKFRPTDKTSLPPSRPIDCSNSLKGINEMEGYK